MMQNTILQSRNCKSVRIYAAEIQIQNKNMRNILITPTSTIASKA